MVATSSLFKNILPNIGESLKDASTSFKASIKKGLPSLDTKSLFKSTKYAPSNDVKGLKQLSTTTFADLEDNPLIKVAANDPNLLKQTVKSNIDEMSTTAVDDASTQATRAANDATGLAKSKKGVVQSTSEAGTTARKYIAENPGKFIAGISVTIIASIALANFTKRNGATCNITSIEPAEGGGHKIRYSPELKILKTDTITLQGTNCVPKIDGETISVIDGSVKNLSVVADGRNITLTTNGTLGTLTLHTNFESQLAGVFGDIAGVVTDALTGITKPINDLGNDWLVKGALIVAALIIFLCIVVYFKNAFFRKN